MCQNNQPIYRFSAETAIENDEIAAFNESMKLNIECGRAIDKAIAESNYELYRYDLKSAVKTVIEEYGAERAAWVLAVTVNWHESDGRLSGSNKAWASGYDTPKPDFYLKTHLAVLDGFINCFREAANESHELNTRPQPDSTSEKPFNTILEFAFETGDASCRYWQEFVVVKSNESVDYDAVEEIISAYMDICCEEDGEEDSDYADIVENIMDMSDLSWEFVGSTIPESRTIHTFWI